MEQGTDLTADVNLDASQPLDLHHPERRREVEAALCAIPGVLATRIVAGFERPIDELHAVTTLERSPKHIVRDVQSMLMARFGVSTDHRVISVAQMQEETVLKGPAARMRIDRVAVEQQGLSAHVSVVLRDGEGQYAGQAEGPASAAGRRRASARATLEALRPRLAEGQVVEIEGNEITEVLGHLLAISLIHFHTPHGAHTLSGSALVKGDEADAIARSVLDALNRSVEEGAGH